MSISSTTTTTCCVVLVAALLATAAGRATEEARADDSIAGGYLGDLRFMYSVYQECAATNELSACLKLKLLAAMDRAARALSDQVALFDGVSLVREENNVVPTTTTKSNIDIEASLPRALPERDAALNGLIFQRLATFLDSHTLQVKLPTGDELARAFNGEEESRGKRKRMHGMLLIPLILGGTLVPLALGALALLAGKAMIVSKLALVLAAIIGIKKLIGGGGSHDNEVVVAGGHSGGWGRTYKEEAASSAAAGQRLAYSAYAPTTST